MPKPQPSEYPVSYETYISKVPEGDIINFLAQQHSDFLTLIRSVPADKALYAYAEGKWTIKELICHVIDAERIFAYRALAFARGEQQSLPPFEEDDYAKNSFANNRSMENLADEFSHQRLANIALFSSFDEAVMKRNGIANNKTVTVNAIIYTIVGHVNHHSNILKERYL
jgi:hypothetical protein